MKRNDDNTGTIIKIPDVSAVTSVSVAQQQLQQQSVFVQRQQPTPGGGAHIEMSRPNVTTSQITLPRAHNAGATGVTVFRSDGNVAPPAAHSGGVAVTTTPSASSQQPPAAHIAQPSVVSQQPPPALKAEQISKSLL